MEVSALRAQILSADALKDFYIFTGDEWAVQKIYIQQIAKMKNLEVYYADDFKEVYSKLKNRGFIEFNRLYVIINDKDLQTSENAQIQLQSGILKKNILIYLWTDVDKRTKFYNKFKDRVVEFEPLSDVTLKKYIKKEIDLSDKNCQKLIDVCEHNYGRILLEIDKIKRAMIVTKAGDMPNNTFEWLLAEGMIYQPPYDAIFDFVDAVLDRKRVRAFDLYQQSVAIGEATMVMLSVLYKNAKAVLQVQSCESSNVAKSTGLSAWEIKNATKHLKKYRIGELVEMLRLIQQVEAGIKKGTITEDFAVEYVLVSVL